MKSLFNLRSVVISLVGLSFCWAAYAAAGDPPAPVAKKVVKKAGPRRGTASTETPRPTSSNASAANTLQIISEAAVLAREAMDSPQDNAAGGTATSSSGPANAPAPNGQENSAAAKFQRGASGLFSQVQLLEQKDQEHGEVGALDRQATGIFDLVLSWGGQYQNRKQRGDGGDFHYARLMVDYLSLATRYQKSAWWCYAQGSMFTFKHAGVLDVDNEIYHFDLRAGHEKFFIGLNIQQQYLLIAPTATAILETALFPQIGGHWQWKLDNLIATELGLTAAAGLYVSGHSSNSSYKIRQQKGFRVSLSTNWQRILYTSDRFPVNYFWANQLAWQKTRHQLTSEAFNGRIKAQELSLVSMIGVGISF